MLLIRNKMSNTPFYGPIIGSLVAELVTYPLLMIKTRYQITNGSIREVIVRLYHNKEFYTGLSWATLSQCTSTTSKYFIYKYINNRVKNKAISGIISGTCSSILTHPLDVIRIYTQMNQLHLFKTNLKLGIRSTLYAGYSKTLLKQLGSAAWFVPFYDLLFEKTNNRSMSMIISSFICTVGMQPFDYLKTREAIQIKTAWKTCFRGLSINLIRTSIHFIITMSCIEYFTINHT